MRRTLVLVIFAGAAAATARPTIPPVPPTPVNFTKPNATLGEVAAVLSKAPAGVTVAGEPAVIKAKCPAAFADTPFWDALESAAAETKTRITLHDGGRAVVLKPRGKNPEISSVSGPFRVVTRSVVGRLRLDDAATHEVQLEAHWEPRVRVYRIDTHPKIIKADDDRGTPLAVSASTARHYPTAAATDMTVNLSGLTRDARRIGVLAGEFRATAAEKLLTFTFVTSGGKLPAAQTLDRVAAALKRIEKDGAIWEVEVELVYPEAQPVFESFEEQRWLRDNRLQLVAPDGKPTDPESEELVASGRRVSATYRFKGADPTAKGWSLVYQTPAPLVEVRVPFELRDIPIP